MDILSSRKMTKKLISEEEATLGAMGKIRKHGRCKICDRLCFYCYYGVLSCEACKQFFRRSITRQFYYACRGNEKCDVTEEGERAKCRRCRLKKCLWIGMDPMKVWPAPNASPEHKHFVEKIIKWQEKLMLGENPKIEDIVVAESGIRKLLDQIMPIGRAYKQIWESLKKLPRAYANRHENVASLLQDPENLLKNANEYCSGPMEFWDKSGLINEIETKGIFSSNAIYILEKDWLLCVETAKAMPFFSRLILQDQISLLKQIILPVTIFASAYYSHTKSAKTVTRGNGFTPISILEPRQFKLDRKMRAICEITMCKIVEKVAAVGLEYQEFLLLFALLFANNFAENLSIDGREMLYQESLQYSKALHKMFQAKFGIFKGAERFAAAMNLMGAVFRAKELEIKLIVYLEVFYDKRDPKDTLPKVFKRSRKEWEQFGNRDAVIKALRQRFGNDAAKNIKKAEKIVNHLAREYEIDEKGKFEEGQAEALAKEQNRGASGTTQTQSVPMVGEG